VRGALPTALLFAAQVAAAATVTDDDGREVTLAGPAARIVTLAPHATELVFAAGAGDRLVAVEASSDHPDAARALPRIGGAGALDRERLLRLRPDLVVAWLSGNRPSDLRWLEKQGIAIYRSEPRSLADIAGNVRELGALAGTAAVARATADRWEAQLGAACRPGGTQRALIVLWDQPLMTVGGRHWLNDLLDRAGYVNVFHDVDRAVFAPAREAVLARGADVILSAVGAPGRQPTPAPVRQLSTAASRPSLRLVETIAELCVGRSAPAGAGAEPTARAHRSSSRTQHSGDPGSRN
jgi:iron complex transport system substrate-binding protein